MTSRVLHLDLETYGTIDLSEVGAHVYAAHPETRVTVVAWAFDDGPVHSEKWPAADLIPLEIIQHIRAGGEIHAHNASFEHAMLTFCYGLVVPVETMHCSMQRALVYGLPAGLADAGAALNLSIRKDKSDRPLMLKMSKPGRTGKPLYQHDPVALEALRVYCVNDVEAERALGKAIPHLSPFERRVSLLDARSNDLGVMIDIPLVKMLRGAADHAIKALCAESLAITKGLVASPGTETSKLLGWIQSQGLQISNLTKETVAAELKDPTLAAHLPDVHRMLEIRQLSAKSSLAKLDAMVACAGKDNRARGLLQYYGASRTGRWAGRRIQGQNLPVPKLDAVVAIRAIEQASGVVPEMVYGSPLAVVASCLRACIIPTPGSMLFSLDLKQIEARVLAWLAGQRDVLDVFRRGEDVYVYAGQRIGAGRALGKVVTLACGFGMGAERFMETAATYDIKLTLAEAYSAVDAWRQANPFIVTFWWQLHKTAIRAINTPGRAFDVGPHVKMKVDQKTKVLKVRKPNGEVLYYHGARVVDGDSVEFDGVYKTAWTPQRMYGGRWAENLTQAVARDVMADAIVRIWERFNWVPVMTSHDEAVWETANALMVNVQKAFEKAPLWALDLPLGSDARLGRRYGK